MFFVKLLLEILWNIEAVTVWRGNTWVIDSKGNSMEMMMILKNFQIFNKKYIMTSFFVLIRVDWIIPGWGCVDLELVEICQNYNVGDSLIDVTA